MSNGDGGQQAADGGQQAATPTITPAAPAAPVSTPEGTGQTQGQAAVAQTATGSTPDHWLTPFQDKFSERDVGVLKRFGSIDELANGYVNAFNLVGRDKIPMPQSEAEWKEVYDRLGRPKEASEYSTPVRDDYPQDFKDQMAQNQEWFRSTVHELGLNEAQASALYSKYTDFVYDRVQAQNGQVASEMQAATEALKTEYGPAYENKLVLANRAVTELGGEDLIKTLDESGLGRHPVIVKAFMKIGEMMAEEVGLDKEGQSVHSNDSLDEQIAEIQSDKAYLDKGNPKHKVLVDKMQKLMQLRHPEPKVAPGTIRLF